MDISYIKKLFSKTFTTKKEQRKIDILNFLNSDKYYKNEFPFPCDKEDTIIKDNYKLFQLIFIERQEEKEIYRILESKVGSDYGRSRNCIISFSNGFYNPLDKNKKLSENITFNGFEIQDVWTNSLNIQKFSFNNEEVYFISINFNQHGFDQKIPRAKKTYFKFCVKREDLHLFFDYFKNSIFTWKDARGKISDTLSNFY